MKKNTKRRKKIQILFFLNSFAVPHIFQSEPYCSSKPIVIEKSILWQVIF